MRLRGDLPKQRASSLDWCANPPGDRRECGRPPTCSEIACCGRRPPRVVIVVVRHPPRVAIVVQTRGSTSSSSHYRGSTSSSCHCRGTNRGFSRLGWSAQPTLLVSIPGAAASSSRYRGVNPADKIPYRGVNPAHKIPPRVVIVVSTPPRVVIVVPAPPRVAIVVSIQRIRSLIVCYDSPRVAIVGSNPGTAASSSCYRGSNRGQYPWRKNTGVSRGTNRGESNVSQLEDGPQRQ